MDEVLSATVSVISKISVSNNKINRSVVWTPSGQPNIILLIPQISSLLVVATVLVRLPTAEQRTVWSSGLVSVIQLVRCPSTVRILVTSRHYWLYRSQSQMEGYPLELHRPSRRMYLTWVRWQHWNSLHVARSCRCTRFSKPTVTWQLRSTFSGTQFD